MAEHSPAEWQELIKQLRALIADPKRSREDRAKAQAILDRIGPSRKMPPPQPRRRLWSDDTFYTDEII